MTYEEFIAHGTKLADYLANALVEKGIVDPCCEIDIHSGSISSWYMRGQNLTGVFPADFDAACAFIAALPDEKTRALQQHMKRVIDCIDKGRADGISDEYIAPLAAVKEALSGNLLPAPSLAQELGETE